MTHSHKPGAKKQQNKKHTSSHSSKRSLKKEAKGRVESYYDNESGPKRRRHISLKASVLDTKQERKDELPKKRGDNILWD